MDKPKQDAHAWDALSGEPEVGYEYFRKFLEMGPGRDLYTLSIRENRPIAYLKGWARDWDWKERARLYDRAQDPLSGALDDVRRIYPSLARQELTKALHELMEADMPPDRRAQAVIRIGKALGGPAA